MSYCVYTMAQCRLSDKAVGQNSDGSSFNPSRPSDADRVQRMACRLASAKPLFEIMLGCRKLDPYENTLHWNSNRNSYIFIQEKVFANVWKMVAILSWPQCVEEQVNNPLYHTPFTPFYFWMFQVWAFLCHFLFLWRMAQIILKNWQVLFRVQ